MLANNRQNRPEIVIGIDLDYTLFKSHKPEIAWIGSQDFWVTLFKSLNDAAEEQAVGIVFVIATSKDGFDDLCGAALCAFRGLLEKYQPNLFIFERGCDWYLANIEGTTRYVCQKSYDTPSFHWVTPHTFSPMIISTQNKASCINNAASYFHIPLTNCILIDDAPWVLARAEKFSIQTVGLTEFHCKKINVECLDDDDYVKPVLERAKAELTEKVLNIIKQIKAKNALTEVQKKICLSEESFFEQLQIERQTSYFNMRNFLHEKKSSILKMPLEELLRPVEMGEDKINILWLSMLGAALGYAELFNALWEQWQQEITMEHLRAKNTWESFQRISGLWLLSYATNQNFALFQTVFQSIGDKLHLYDWISKERAWENDASPFWMLFYTSVTHDTHTLDNIFKSILGQITLLDYTEMPNGKYSVRYLIETIPDPDRKEAFLLSFKAGQPSKEATAFSPVLRFSTTATSTVLTTTLDEVRNQVRVAFGNKLSK